MRSFRQQRDWKFFLFLCLFAIAFSFCRIANGRRVAQYRGWTSGLIRSEQAGADTFGNIATPHGTYFDATAAAVYHRTPKRGRKVALGSATCFMTPS